MKRISLVFVCAILAGTLLFGLLEASGAWADKGAPADLDAVAAAILETVAESAELRPVVAMYQTRLDALRLDADHGWASAWLTPVDPDTGQDVPTEPGLALSRWLEGRWQVALPGDKTWLVWLEAAPLSILPEEEKADWLESYHQAQAELPDAPLTDYLLPWEQGRVLYLSQSTHHDLYDASGYSHYSFDFYASTGSQVVMFEILAAKAGYVYNCRDSQADGDASVPGNYIILKDITTTPASYQLYLHLSQNSIPPELKPCKYPVSDPVFVQQGEVIGIADDTGKSTNHHLHFQVHTNPNSYWGQSVDMIFDDVTINGGRPRIAIDKDFCNVPGDICNQFSSTYISQNKKPTDPTPAVGDFTNIQNGQAITSQILHLEGSAADSDSGIASIVILAGVNGAWQGVSPTFYSDSFSYDLDLCEASIPDGPLVLGLRVKNTGRTQTDLYGLRILSKSVTCTPEPPACIPGADQVALYTEPNYGGTCSVFDPGLYQDDGSLKSIGGDSTSSVLVGENAKVTFYSAANFNKRAETLTRNDSNLSDNLIQDNWVNSMIVQGRNDFGLDPLPQLPASGAVISQTESFMLYWRNPLGLQEYQVELRSLTQTYTSSWQSLPYWSPASGESGFPWAAGVYQWRVRGRSAGNETAWSIPFAFTLLADGLPLDVGHNLPFVDDVEDGVNDWIADGLWHIQSGTSPVTPHSGSALWWFGELESNDARYFSAHSGSLTSPPIKIPASGTPYLTFWTRYQTENGFGYWDQRWVQISVDGEPFQNLFQFAGDPMQEWMLSPRLDLSAYQGQTVRIRFYFETVDHSGAGWDNDFLGWFIDDVLVKTDSQIICPADDLEPNNTPLTATPITQTAMIIQAAICPNADQDYYVFNAQAGDRLLLDIDAQVLGSSLDSVLALLDEDGTSVLAEHDDEEYAVKRDSLISLVLPRSGTYYARVRPYEYPGQGDSGQTYTLHFGLDAEIPQVKLLDQYKQGLPGFPVPLRAVVTETISGVNQASFYWHGSDWTNPAWLSLGDATFQDGVWQLLFDPNILGEPQYGSLYFQARDWAGNLGGSGIFGLAVDLEPPAVALSSLPPVLSSNVVSLSWFGADDLTGLARFELDRRQDSQEWSGIFSQTLSTSYWEIVPLGTQLSYRLRAFDVAGNSSAYETTSSLAPTFLSLCASQDAFEPDNEAGVARSLQVGEAPQAHDFCPMLEIAVDQDWITFTARAGQVYVINVLPAADSPAAPVLTLYAEDGLTELSQGAATGLGQPTHLLWQSDRDATVYLRVANLHSTVIGAPYMVGVFESKTVFLPVTRR